MKKVLAGAMLALAMLLGASFLLTRTATEAAAPTPSPSQVVLSQWNEIGRKLIAMAQDFPEDKYDFKPTPAQRTFAEQLLHATASMPYSTAPATGKKPGRPDDPNTDGREPSPECRAVTRR